MGELSNKENTSNNEILEIIHKLLITVKNNVEAFNTFESDEIGTYDELFVRIECSFDYCRRIVSSQTSQTAPYKKELKYWIDFGKYYNRLANQFTELKKIPYLLTEKYKITEIQSIQYLNAFFDRILIKTINEIDLKNIANRFIKDLEKENPNWNLTVFINGIWLEEEEVLFNENILIRRPKPDDFNREKALTLREVDIKNHCLITAIIEINKPCSSKVSLYDYLNKLYTCLMLYKTTSFFPVKCIYKTDSILLKSDYSIYPEKTNIYSYGISSSDREKMKFYIDEILPILPDANWRMTNTELAHIYLAIERYKDALEDKNIESRITTAVTSLEALYCDGDNREIAHKLSQRLSFFLRFFGYQALELYSEFKKETYSIRSCYAHGSIKKGIDKSKLNKICENVLNYSRISIITHLQMYTKFNFRRKQFINLIDSALIDENSLRNFMELLKSAHL